MEESTKRENKSKSNKNGKIGRKRKRGMKRSMVRERPAIDSAGAYAN